MTSAHKRPVAAPYKHAVIFGVICAWVVLIVTIVAMGAWKSRQALLLSVGFSVGTFVVVTLIAMGLNAVVAKQHHDSDTQDGPVLH